MLDSNEQDDTGRGYNNQGGLGGNLVQENNVMAEGEDQFHSNQQPSNDLQQTGDENSFHVDQFFEKIQNNPNFSQKRK